MKQKIITVSSPCGGVGKTTIAKELSVIYANAKTSTGMHSPAVCLIDADLGKGAQSVMFRLSPEFSIEDWNSDILKTSESYELGELISYYTWPRVQKYLTRTDIKSLFVLPTNPAYYYDVFNDSPVISKFHTMLLVLKNYFDIIIIDTGSMSRITREALVLSDSNLLLLNDDKRSMVRFGNYKHIVRDLEIPLSKIVPIINNYPNNESDRFFELLYIKQLTAGMGKLYTLCNEERLWIYANLAESFLIGRERSPFKDQLTSLALALIPEISIPL